MLRKLLLGTLVLLSLSACKKEKEDAHVEKQVVIEKPKEVKEFGFNLNNFFVLRDTIKQGDSFGEILAKNRIDYSLVYQIAEQTKDSFDIRKLQAGKPYTILCSKDSLQIPQCFIYQPNKIDYVVVNFADSIHAYSKKKPVKVVEREATGTITSSLSEAILEKGMDYQVSHELADIYAWTIDFFRLQAGDRFKVIYEERYIDDTIYAGMGKIKAAYFEHMDESFYSFRFKTDTIHDRSDYYDEEANSLRRFFLKAPINYSRISSRFTKRRFHPVQKRWKAHLGTDYAAPRGTPIWATANGIVTKSSYTGGNGKYVKIRHNSVYETQYLHMSRRAVKVGEYVKQGDIIGYVGSTGLATGPHVCYRFWKNGRQVDPFSQDLPSAEPIKPEIKERYLEFVQPVKTRLDNIIFEEEKEEYIAELN
ncbi:Murein DD-endopeptidase MepM and murein hydrolase activator NlpD, contain LysM domain [Zhouia amylolytica]|uniref:Metalloprotease yebA n=2 Tax=Zhouia amylolytica TaxID=376730 RepID=W2UJW0_9FLAO|nr:peptidoglycan DD-metalloendopeptidase family protein [Zhouia amylolytica]ETN94460.1 metalloprotease yebA [Zhouia amylolytica AD3]MCQ0110318.1 peptidoglycan DD-metalloendopeptidase family protein [Zhouia amylolytica]SFT12368.1 Murein DD-endopeptidase MepM and murein hydrolase activator NlpD, contain LysM domain [Zhouia amylolytica]